MKNKMDLIPGFLQGLTRVIVSHPFDYVRIYLQTNHAKSIPDFFREHSVRNLYRGVTIPLLTVPVDRAIQFKSYEYLNKHMNPFLSGGLCGILSSVFMLPSTYICNNYILHKDNKNLLKFISNISYKNLWSGFKPEFVRSISATSIYLGVYGNLRNKYGNSTTQSIINSSVAGVVTWTITYPIETIKVELQTTRHRSIRHIVTSRIQTYGIMNLWKGIMPIYIRTVPSSVLGMLVYEKSKKILLGV